MIFNVSSGLGLWSAIHHWVQPPGCLVAQTWTHQLQEGADEVPTRHTAGSQGHHFPHRLHGKDWFVMLPISVLYIVVCSMSLAARLWHTMIVTFLPFLLFLLICLFLFFFLTIWTMWWLSLFVVPWSYSPASPFSFSFSSLLFFSFSFWYFLLLLFLLFVHLGLIFLILLISLLHFFLFFLLHLLPTSLYPFS